MTVIRVDASQFIRLGNTFRAAGKDGPLALARAINHTGDKARTAMRRVLVGQTGLKARTINKAVTSTRSFNGSAYVIKSRGGDIRLKFFGARETGKGVSAAPWNQRRIYAGAFIKGGKFPKRVALNLGGNVFKRVGSGRTPIQVQKSGLFIPEEMIKGKSEAAFYSVVDTDLAPRIAHELYRILGA